MSAPEAVPEPSGELLLAISVAVVSAAALRKRRVHGSRVAILVFAVLAAGAERARAAQIDEMFIFGDSHSDVGNWGPLTGEGRFSNGPVWVDELATVLELPPLFPGFVANRSHPQGGNDFAFGAARTGEGYDLYGTFSVPRVGNQVETYLSKYQPTPSTLLVLLAGQNDFINGQRDASVPVTNLVQHITRLAEAGGQRFLVASRLHSIGHMPYFRDSPEVETFSALAGQFNEELPAALDQLAADFDITIHQVDLAALEEAVVSDPAAFGFTNTTDFALGNPNADPDTYLYWDDVHFTTKFHRLFGQQAALAVPEPNNDALALAGLTVLPRIRRRFLRSWTLAVLLLVDFSPSSRVWAGTFTLSEATVVDINRAFDDGILTSEKLVQLYRNRIEAYDDAGPALNTMITLNPDALAIARALDEERRTSGPRSPLHGVPIVLKDLVDMAGLPTSSGTRALRDSYPPDDAFVVRKLRDAGAVVLGKANLDEFGCCSATLSSLGGQTRNPYDTTRLPGGSSGGTAAAIAANFAVIGTGTDWWGSIQEPASLNAVVGLMPTRALISGDGMMPPPSERRGVMGPIARSVADAAAMLDVIAGVDLNDPVTAAAEGRIPDSYLDSLDAQGLNGARIGLVQNFLPPSGSVRNLVNTAVADMQALGAEVISVQVALPNGSTYYNDVEYGANRYLESLGPNRRFETLRDVIASGEVLPSMQGLLAGLNGDVAPESDPDYAPVVATRSAFEAALLELMDANQLDALIYPPLLSPAPTIGSTGTVWETDADFRNLAPSPFLGFPSITLPMGVMQVGRTSTMPVGIEFLGRPFSEPTLISLAYSFEQGTHHRSPPTSTPPLPGETVPEPTGQALAGMLGSTILLHMALRGRRTRRMNSATSLA